MSDIREPGRVTFLIEQARLDALRDAAAVVRAYADERNLRLKVPTPSEDITAALRVAADRIDSLTHTSMEDPL